MMYEKLPADQLAGQFMLSRRPEDLPVGWRTRTLRGWVLATHPRLPVADIRTPDGALAGWVAGYPIASGTICPPAVHIPAEAAASAAALESAIYCLGGRFAVVALTDAYERVYLDACGSLSAVYSAEAGVVASTPAYFDDQTHPWDQELIRFLNMPASGLWYPFGMTPRRNVWRIIPNHFLDLNLWATRRHWPTALFSVAAEPAVLMSQIAKTIRETIDAVAKSYPLHMSLTAGRDSRLLLACAKDHLDCTRFFTFARKRATADTHIARALARRFGLDHVLLAIEPATPAQQSAWLARVGHCVSGDIARTHPTLGRLDPWRALLPGMAGEVGRAFYWRDGDSATMRLTPEDTVARCHLPANDRIVSAAGGWLDELAGHSAFAILDLLYIEQRLGCWGGPQQYGGDPWSVAQLFPLAHRAIFTATLSLPPEYRANERLVTDICRQEWPELLDLPFNEFSGWQRYPRRIAKSVYFSGHNILTKLRKI
ncbi:MAG TPA: hypothetical protein VFU22_06945 [Roseiflexaceae bacterium]|nr:hypothetical protein [Roseiflexaceae bacterium]